MGYLYLAMRRQAAIQHAILRPKGGTSGTDAALGGAARYGALAHAVDASPDVHGRPFRWLVPSPEPVKLAEAKWGANNRDVAACFVLLAQFQGTRDVPRQQVWIERVELQQRNGEIASLQRAARQRDEEKILAIAMTFAIFIST